MKRPLDTEEYVNAIVRANLMDAVLVTLWIAAVVTVGIAVAIFDYQITLYLPGCTYVLRFPPYIVCILCLNIVIFTILLCACAYASRTYIAPRLYDMVIDYPKLRYMLSFAIAPTLYMKNKSHE